MTRRQGFSLVELLVALTATSIILGTVALVIHSALRINGAAGRALQRDYALDQLCDRVRRDAHDAWSAKLEAGGTDKLLLRMPAGKEVEFRGGDGRIERIVRHEGQIVHQDRWPLGDGQHALWTIHSEEHATLLTLVIAPPDKEQDKETVERRGLAIGRPHSQRMAAVVGWHHRFEQQPNPDESGEAGL